MYESGMLTHMSTSPVSNQPAAPPSKPRERRVWLRRIVGLIIILIALFAIYLLLAPSAIDPVAYQVEPAPPATGAIAPNNALESAEIIAHGLVDGPEDVDVDAEGRIYGGTNDGKVVRVLPDGTVETFATTGGRPLGMDFDPQGNLVVCDGIKGLLSIDPAGTVTTLVAADDPAVKLGFTDDVDVTDEGVSYFSDASDKFGVGQYMFDLLEGRPHGRLLRYDPATKVTTVLLDKLYFANGVAVAPQKDYVLVNETYRYRVTRYWLAGPDAGKAEVFADNLPGFPDGISTSPRGTYWVAIFTVRNSSAEFMAPHPWLRSALTKLPAAVWPKPEPYGYILELDEHGKILRTLQDPTGEHVSVITSVHEKDGMLYLGTLLNNWIARIKVPESAAPSN